VKKLLIVSFDALGDAELEAAINAGRMPNTEAFLKTASLTRGVRSLFPTLTYPVHASVVTGLLPAKHGVLGNTPPLPVAHPKWYYEAANIRVKTLWEEVREAGGSIAAVLWPVTGASRDIRWNIPEIMRRPGESQVLLNLKNGSVFLQAACMFRHGHLLSGIEQPQVDHFTTACAADLLAKKKPNLALVHLTAYDSLCHKNGPGTEGALKGADSLDWSLGVLLEAAGPEYSVLVFSDHSQLPVQKEILLNEYLVKRGLLTRAGGGGDVPGKDKCFFECCSGSAFFWGGALSSDTKIAIKDEVSHDEGFGRFLREDELSEAGRQKADFGIAAKPLFVYEVCEEHYKGQHGYPTDYAHYDVFYALRSDFSETGAVFRGGSLLDIKNLALRALGLSNQER